MPGTTSFSANSLAVCAISRCSFDTRSGVNTDEGSISSNSQEAPRAAVSCVIKTFRPFYRPSAVVVLQEVLDGLADFLHLAVKEMVSAVDHHQLLRFGQPAVKSADFS